jgi:hypothetical protein
MSCRTASGHPVCPATSQGSGGEVHACWPPEKLSAAAPRHRDGTGWNWHVSEAGCNVRWPARLLVVDDASHSETTPSETGCASAAFSAGDGQHLTARRMGRRCRQQSLRQGQPRSLPSVVRGQPRRETGAAETPLHRFPHRRIRHAAGGLGATADPLPRPVPLSARQPAPVSARSQRTCRSPPRNCINLIRFIRSPLVPQFCAPARRIPTSAATLYWARRPLGAARQPLT